MTNSKEQVISRADIAQRLQDELGIPYTDAKQIVDDFFSTISTELESGETVGLKGFGKFEVREWKERLGRNIKTGESVKIEPRRKVHFTPSRTLKKRIAKYAGPGIE